MGFKTKRDAVRFSVLEGTARRHRYTQAKSGRWYRQLKTRKPKAG